MTHQELVILNDMLTYVAENRPGGLTSEEHDVAFQVACWTTDGVPVRPICPHCGTPQPRGTGRLEWLEDHIDSLAHRTWWGIKNSFHRVGL